MRAGQRHTRRAPRRDLMERELCPKCGRSLAIMRGQHDWQNVFTLRMWHLTPDRKERCTNTHWRQGAADVVTRQ